MPSGQMLSSLHSDVINAETIGEVIVKAGLKTVVIHYPASMLARTKNKFIVDGEISTKHYAEIVRKVGRGG